MSAPSANHGSWLLNALATVALWGIWGAFSGLSPQRGFPDTLVYCVWAGVMIVPAIFVLAKGGWRIDRTPAAIGYGAAVGLLGAGGQMLLFYAVTRAPAFLIFPVVSLSPVITIGLSVLFLRERTGRLGLVGIVLALLALPMFDYAPGGSTGGATGWLLPAVGVMAAWGVQAFFMKTANRIMSAESIFCYMTVAGLLLVPVAWAMTTTSRPINLGWDGPGLAAVIQLLNAIGALTLVFAFRYGKAIVVAPLANAGAPLATALISMAALGAVPGTIKLVGIALALVASLLLAIEPEDGASVSAP